ncbi:hypothetical protein GF352_00465 [archaeon]|nr:hypothetical protein [archaeon]
MILPVSKSCHKIIKHVFKTNGVKISKLLKATSVSQKIGYRHINKLEEINVLTENSNGSLRIIKPDLKTETGRLVYNLIEKERELKLIKKNPKIKNSILNLKKHANKLLIESAVIFGPFINNNLEEKINILIISDNNDKKILPFLQKCFSNVENAVSARILSKQGFIKFRKTKQNLFQELFKNHVCVYNSDLFLKLIA